jgi:transcription initiation factor TFIID TATA-box-binding protein
MITNLKIVNIVATASLNQLIDLESLSRRFPQTVTYSPDVYPQPTPAYFKSRDMEGKVSIFASGKMISVGTKSEEAARHELHLVAKLLEKVQGAKLKTMPKIENMVATADLGLELDLKKISFAKEVEVIHEPKQFPGAIVKFPVNQGNMATFLIFGSGKLVCVGLKNKESIQKALRLLTSRLTIEPKES